MDTTQGLVVHVQEMRACVPCSNILEIISFDRVKTTTPPGLISPVTTTMMHRDRTSPVVDLRALFGLPLFEDELNELRGILKARENDHVAWLEELRECCSTGKAFTKATDPHKCAFGKWYDALTGSAEAMQEMTGGDRTIRHIIHQFDTPHKSIHGIATCALSLAESGDTEGANAIIESAWNTDLAMMRELFASLLREVEANRKSLYIVLQTADDALWTLLVDGALSIVNMAGHSIQEVGFAGDMVRGVVPFEGVGETLMMDLDRIHERVLRGAGLGDVDLTMPIAA